LQVRFGRIELLLCRLDPRLGIDPSASADDNCRVLIEVTGMLTAAASAFAFASS
jgi:hypothetical protein